MFSHIMTHRSGSDRHLRRRGAPTCPRGVPGWRRPPRLVSARMERLCERPGCSDRASVAYGMRAKDLVFWLDTYSEGADGDVGVLCRRHADSMVVPRGWTLDDLRDPELHLFRPPAPVATSRVRASRLPRPVVVAEQLELTPEHALTRPPVDVGSTSELPPPDVSTSEPDVDAAADAAEPGPWAPAFDEADDLGGLLDARSPLLSRAFKTAERPGS